MSLVLIRGAVVLALLCASWSTVAAERSLPALDSREMNDMHALVPLPEGIPTRPVAPGPPPGQFRVTIVNQTRHTIYDFHLAQPANTGWGANRLGAFAIPPGQSFALHLPRGACRHDIRAVAEGHAEFTRFDHDFCRAPELVIRAFESAPLPASRPGVTFFRVTNRTRSNIAVLTVTPAGLPE